MTPASNNADQSPARGGVSKRMPISSDARRMLATFGISAIVHAVVLTLIHAAPQTVDTPAPVLAAMDDRAPVEVEIFVLDAPKTEPVVEEALPEPEPVVEEAPPEPVVERAPETEREIPEEPEPADEATPPEAEIAAADAAPEREEEPEPVDDATPDTDMVAIGSDDDGPELARGSRGGTTTGAAPEPVDGNGASDTTGTETVSREGADDGDALDGLRDRYRRSLERRLARLQNAYSPTLRRLMLEGTVVVVIELDDDGRIVAVGLSGSSGDERLDEYALNQVRRLGRLVAPPPELGLAARTVELPISYSIQS